MVQLLQIAIGGLADGCMYALIALGFSLIYRVTGALSLAQGGFCIFAALTCYSLNHEAGLHLALAVPAAIAVTTLLGLGLGILSFVPALDRLSHANILMLTAGLLTLLEGLSIIFWGSQPYALAPFSGAYPIEIGPILIPTQWIWVYATALIIIVAVWYVVTRTGIGRALRACAENPGAARLMGIDVRRMTLISFGFAALIAAVAGVVSAPTTSLQFDTGRVFTNFGFIAAVIGGMSSFIGAIAGGILLGIATALASAYISPLFATAISLLLLLLILVVRPDGLVRPRVTRRQDVRADAQNLGHLARLLPSTAWVAGAVALGLVILLPAIVTSSGVMSSLAIAAILFIALIGLDFLMGFAGQVSLGQAGFMAIGGYTYGYLAIKFELPSLAGVAIGVFVSLACASLLALVTLRLRGLYLALATLAFGLLVESCAVGFTGITGGPSGLVGIPSLSIGSLEFDGPVSMYYLALIVDLVLLAGLFGLLSSGFGRALKAIRSDEMAAAALGVPVMRYKFAAFLVSAALASISGSLYASFFNFLSPEMVNVSRSIELVAMMVIGGEGSLIGASVGSALLTILPTIFQPLAAYKIAFSGCLLVVCFLYLPQGFYGSIVRGIAFLDRRRGNFSDPADRRVEGSAV